MTHSRRAFLGTSVAAAGLPLVDIASKVTTIPVSDDPLGVRGDFPGASTRTYLNTAYQAIIPRQVADAGRAFIDHKSTNPLLVGEMMRKTDEVRGQFARLIGATPEEVGFLFSTSEGENLVAQALDLQPGDDVVIDELHYESEFVLYRALEERDPGGRDVSYRREGVWRGCALLWQLQVGAGWVRPRPALCATGIAGSHPAGPGRVDAGGP
jgi:hypothetical protein